MPSSRSFLMLLLLPIVVGCQSHPATSENPFKIDSREYDRIYTAAIDVLRDAGFRVDRKDHRFGVLTSHPLASPTLFEPWQPHNSQLNQAGTSTISQVQRVVTIQLTPTEPAHPEPDKSSPDTYHLKINVLMQRLAKPTRIATRTAGNQVFHELGQVPSELQQREIPGMYWQTIGHDPDMEQKLLRAIIKRSFEPVVTN